MDQQWENQIAMKNIESSLHDDLGGFWIDNQNIVHVGLVDMSKASQVHSRSGNTEVIIEKVDHSIDDLNLAFDNAAENLDRRGMLSGVSIQLNEENNNIDVKVDSSKQMISRRYDGNLASSSNTFYDVYQTIRDIEEDMIDKGEIYNRIFHLSYEDIPDEYSSSSCINKFDCFPYLRGGLSIQNIGSMRGNECTIGFNATQGNTRYFLTAAHCGRKGDGFRQVGGGPGGRYIGHIDHLYGGDGDAARVKVVGPWRLTRWIYAKTKHVNPGGQEWQALKIEGRAHHNHSRRGLVCYSGVPSDYVCGSVITSRGTFPTESGIKTNFWLASFPAQHGDSGGPVFLPGNRNNPHKVLAYGLISSFNPIRFFNHTVGPNIIDLEQQMGVRIVTE